MVVHRCLEGEPIASGWHHQTVVEKDAKQAVLDQNQLHIIGVVSFVHITNDDSLIIDGSM